MEFCQNFIFWHFPLLPLVWGTDGPVSPPTTLPWSCPSSAGSRGAILHTCHPTGPHQSPQTTKSTPKTTVFISVRGYVYPSVHTLIHPSVCNLFLFVSEKMGENSEKLLSADLQFFAFNRSVLMCPSVGWSITSIFDCGFCCFKACSDLLLPLPSRTRLR